MSKFISFINNDTVIKWLEYFLIALFVILIIWDFYLALDDLNNNTISKVIQNNVDSGLFILIYFWGAICANIFFPVRHKPRINPTVGTAILYIVAILIWIVDAGKKVDNIVTVDLYKNLLGMAFGFIIGFIFWRQRQLYNSLI